jgi:hypothetical protein
MDSCCACGYYDTFNKTAGDIIGIHCMSKQASKFILIAILLLSSGLITVFLRPADIVSNTPIYSDDYSLHLSECLSAKRFLSTAGKCWGYDPFLLAGFPRGTLADADNKAWELLYWAVSPVMGEGLGFKVYVLLFFLTYPLMIYGAARNFNLSVEQSMLAAFLAILFFHLSLAKDFVSWGMFSYVFAVYFSLYVLSAYYRLLQQFSWKRYLAVALAFSLLVMMHILAIIHIALPVLILYIAYFKKMTVRQKVAILFIPFIAGIVNSYWIVPMLQFFSDKTTRPGDYEFTLQIKSLIEPLRVYINQRKTTDYNAPFLNLNNTFLDVLFLVFSVSGFCCWYKKRLRHLIISFVSSFIFIFFVAFYGSHTVFFAQLQPERFTVPLTLLLIIPSGIGIYNAFVALLKGRSVAAVVFIFCAAFVLLYRPVVRPFITLFKLKPYRISCAFPEKLGTLLSLLEKNTTREGRILIEDSEYSRESPLHEYYGGHFPGLFPEYVKREYLCGPRPMYPIKHSYASFVRGVLFDKNIADYTTAELKECFATYNVRWIVCWYKESKKLFERFPGYIIKIADVDEFSVYEVKRVPSFFIKGRGTVHAEYNRLELKNVIAEDNEIIISYHWMKTLRIVQGGSIERAFLGGDPIGFIKIKNPPQSFVVMNSY